MEKSLATINWSLLKSLLTSITSATAVAIERWEKSAIKYEKALASGGKMKGNWKNGGKVEKWPQFHNSCTTLNCDLSIRKCTYKLFIDLFSPSTRFHFFITNYYRASNMSTVKPPRTTI